MSQSDIFRYAVAGVMALVTVVACVISSVAAYRSRKGSHGR